MRFPKATKRVNGAMMMSTSIVVNIGLSDIVDSIVDYLSLYPSDEQQAYFDTLTKTFLWKRTLSTKIVCGHGWFPEGSCVEEVIEKFGIKTTEKAKELFPELIL